MGETKLESSNKPRLEAAEVGRLQKSLNSFSVWMRIVKGTDGSDGTVVEQ